MCIGRQVVYEQSGFGNERKGRNWIFRGMHSEGVGVCMYTYFWNSTMLFKISHSDFLGMQITYDYFVIMQGKRKMT